MQHRLILSVVFIIYLRVGFVVNIILLLLLKRRGHEVVHMYIMLILQKDNRTVYVTGWGGGRGRTSTILEPRSAQSSGWYPSRCIYVPIIHILCVLNYYTVVGRWVVEICIRYARAQYNYIQLYAIIWYIPNNNNNNNKGTAYVGIIYEILRIKCECKSREIILK